MAQKVLEKDTVVIKFAGDSGDGIQLIGNQFANNTAVTGHDLNTFPDFPAEIRAPQGTLFGVSGFQIHFGNKDVYTPGDEYDVLVVMNAAGLKSNIKSLKKNGIIIANENGFDKKNLKLSGYEENPLKNNSLTGYQIYVIPVSKLNKEALKDFNLGIKEKERCKNMFFLGFIYWLYNRSIDTTLQLIQTKFKNRIDLQEANSLVLKTGFKHGEITEVFNTRYHVKNAPLSPGKYRSILGNTALSIGLIVAARKAKLPLLYATYPITPASDILHQLAKYKNYDVRTLQVEDEIAAVCTAIGASFGGALGVTGSSGPGIALKGEGIGLATMLELPLIILNIQRSGPSTGMPTKTEQADLLQALYGRNGECPIVVLAVSTPSNCFEMAYKAVEITLRYMVPVMLLSDGYIANGAEVWAYPKADDLPEIEVNFANQKNTKQGFMPYLRNTELVRPWAIPGTPELQHRIGGLEKENETGNVSYDAKNHEKMVIIRQQKVDNVVNSIPDSKINIGANNGKVLVLGWGSTYGVITSAIKELNEESYSVSHLHLHYINPLPSNISKIFKNFKKILIPEINNGQLAKVIRDKFLINTTSYTKIQGLPITKYEIKKAVLNFL